MMMMISFLKLMCNKVLHDRDPPHIANTDVTGTFLQNPLAQIFHLPTDQTWHHWVSSFPTTKVYVKKS
jgi:hypothetical protein